MGALASAEPTLPAKPASRWWHWLVPPRRKWKWAIIRLALLIALVFLFKNHVVTWALMAHNSAWKWQTGSTRNCSTDVHSLMHCGEPGTRTLESWGEEQAWAEANDARLLPTLLQLSIESQSASVRAAALEGLCRFWDERIPSVLASALMDSDGKVRRIAAEQIFTLRRYDLVEALAQAADRENDTSLRETMANISQKLSRDPAAQPPPSGVKTVKVAAIQFRSELANAELNRSRVEPLIRQAATGGAKIVVLPETAISGYTSQDLRTAWQMPGREMDSRFRHGIDPTLHAESVPGASTEKFGRLSKELGIYLTVPLLEKADDGKYYNTIVLVDPQGNILLHYRKLNPWPPAECAWASKGDHGHQFVDTPFGRLALLVCYDINFEARQLKRLNVDTLLYCIAWVDIERSRWFHVDLPSIAQSNNINIIGANWTVEKKPDWFGYGQSLVIDRDGRVLTRASQDVGEEILYADLPIGEARKLE